MVEQVKRPGWVYVLHDSNDSGLALQIKLGLNRLGHQIWVRERDAPDQDDWKAHSIGIERAGFIVVLETAHLLPRSKGKSQRFREACGSSQLISASTVARKSRDLR